MTNERKNELTNYSIYNISCPPLTDEEHEHGYHFCEDWDGLFIGPGDYEWDCCRCHPKKWAENENISKK